MASNEEERGREESGIGGCGMPMAAHYGMPL